MGANRHRADILFDSTTGRLYIDADGRDKKRPRLLATVPIGLKAQDINVSFISISSLIQAQKADLSTIAPEILASLPLRQARVIDVETLDPNFRPQDDDSLVKYIFDLRQKFRSKD